MARDASSSSLISIVTWYRWWLGAFGSGWTRPSKLAKEITCQSIWKRRSTEQSNSQQGKQLSRNKPLPFDPDLQSSVSILPSLKATTVSFCCFACVALWWLNRLSLVWCLRTTRPTVSASLAFLICGNRHERPKTRIQLYTQVNTSCFSVTWNCKFSNTVFWLCASVT